MHKTKWKVKGNAFAELYGLDRVKQTPQGQQADEVARDRYLSALRSPAPVNWFSDHLREEQRYRGAVYIAIKTLMDQASSAEIIISRWERTDKDSGDLDAKRPLEREHPLCQLLHRPNPQDSKGMLLRRMVQGMYLTGSSLLWRVDNGFDEPIELWNIPTGTYQPVAISAQYPNGAYRVLPYFPGPLAQVPGTWSAGGIAVDAENMLVTRFPHPLVQQEGQSPLAACDLALDTLESIDRCRFSKMRRGIFPSAVAELDANIKFPDDAELIRLQQQIYQLIGSPDRAGKVAIPTPGMKLAPWGDTNIEVGFTESWSQLVSFVLSIFGITKSIAFMNEDPSYGALYASIKQFNLLTLCPLLSLISDSFNHNLVHPFFGEDLHVEFKPKKIDDEQLDETKLGNDLRCGALRMNEYRVKRNYVPVDEAWGMERAWDKSQPGNGMTGTVSSSLAATEDPAIHNTRPANAAGEGSLGSRMDTAKVSTGTGKHDTAAQAAEQQQVAAANTELRNSVGGVQGLLNMATSVYEGKIPREAAMNQVRIIYGFSQAEVESMFPDIKPEKTADDDEPEPMAKPVEQPSTKSFADNLDMAESLLKRISGTHFAEKLEVASQMEQSNGHDKGWITIGSKPGAGGGAAHGGAHVFLDSSGTIEEGPANLEGKKPSELSSKPSGNKPIQSKPTGNNPVQANKPTHTAPMNGGSKPGGNKPSSQQSTKPSSQQSKPASPQSDLKVGESISAKVIPKLSVAEESSNNYITTLDKPAKAAIQDYTAEGYSAMNSAMRKCPPDFSCVSGDMKAQIDIIESAIAKAPKFKEPVDVYRGVSPAPHIREALLKTITECKEKGKAFTMPSFTSTSLHPKVATQGTFGSDANSLLFKIKAKSGLYVESITDNPREFEILQSSKTKYKVHAVAEAVIDASGTLLPGGKLGRKVKKQVIYLEEI